jgi:hypothetical protein
MKKKLIIRKPLVLNRETLLLLYVSGASDRSRNPPPYCDVTAGEATCAGVTGC